ncbi:hypothetical protein GCM10010406_11170 [Streptomyces thermolineatus]|uniref:Rv2525c-like glycoside hydrolase-like domain-containing protein n=1 Tax=Streptomyces thermolineatus TaxID=44033 RepID=A0ABN3L2R5_9ACTN
MIRNRTATVLLAALLAALSCMFLTSAPAWSRVGAPAEPADPTAPTVRSGHAARANHAAPAAPAAPAASASLKEGADLAASGAQVFQGRAFDTCTAPPLSTMAAWRSSGYGAVGVYVGGRARACHQQQLTREWVRAVSDMGWRIIPVYVGSQSPCVTRESKRPFPIDIADPVSHGAEEARDAVMQARALGIVERSPVYLDMEAYAPRGPRCSEPVVSFTRGWSQELRRYGYFPGFYSSAASGITDIAEARRIGIRDLPEVVWYARWNARPALAAEPVLAAGHWTPNRRLHQYEGNVKETHGGRSMLIDRNVVDAPVAVVER